MNGVQPRKPAGAPSGGRFDSRQRSAPHSPLGSSTADAARRLRVQAAEIRSLVADEISRCRPIGQPAVGELATDAAEVYATTPYGRLVFPRESAPTDADLDRWDAAVTRAFDIEADAADLELDLPPMPQRPAR